MAEPETKGGKITRDPEAVAIDAINKAMAQLNDDQKHAVYCWYKRKFAYLEVGP